MDNFSNCDTPALSRNDQGSFLNKCSTKISQTPTLDLAYLSNTRSDTEPDVVINLNPICLTWCDFYTLFFTSPSGAFWVNPSSLNSCAVLFNNQNYESTQKKCILFNIIDQIKKAWSIKYSKLESNITPQANLLLNRETFYIKGLGNATYAVGLGLDQALSVLLSNNQIVPADAESSATVKFIVSFKYYSCSLNTSILINFPYITKIPCFKNVAGDCEGFCPYSNDTNCRPCFEYSDENSILSFFQDNELPEQKALGEQTVVSQNSSHYLSNVIDNQTAAKTKVTSSDETFASSQW